MLQNNPTAAPEQPQATPEQPQNSLTAAPEQHQDSPTAAPEQPQTNSRTAREQPQNRPTVKQSSEQHQSSPRTAPEQPHGSPSTAPAVELLSACRALRSAACTLWGCYGSVVGLLSAVGRCARAAVGLLRGSRLVSIYLRDRVLGLGVLVLYVWI